MPCRNCSPALGRLCGDRPAGAGAGADGASDERNPWAPRAGAWPPNGDLAGGAAAYAGAGAGAGARPYAGAATGAGARPYAGAATGAGAGRAGWLPRLPRKDAAVLGRDAETDGAAAVARLGLAAAVVVGRDGL